MSSVTARIKEINQPYGGYLPSKMFICKQYSDNKEVKSLSDKYYSMVQGTMTDDLVRLGCGFNKNDVFRLAILGANLLDAAMLCSISGYNGVMAINKTRELLSRVNGLDNNSLHSVYRLVELEGCYRNVNNVLKVDVYSLLNPCKYSEFNTMASNIRAMVERTVKFIRGINKGKIYSGLTFEGGYTLNVNSGDCDYIVCDTLIDLKCSVSKYMRSDWSLQLLMYYIMGLHSENSSIFENVRYLCIFNAVYNKSYTLDISKIDDKTMYIVSKDIIGYSMIYNNIHKWRDVRRLRK